MAARQVFDTMDKDGEGIIDRSVCDNAMSATKAKFDAKESGTVTLADGRVVPASSVPPGTKLAGGATMPEAAKDGTVKMPDGKTVKPAPKVKVGGKPKMSKWAALKAKSKMLIGFGVKSKAAVPMVTLADGTKVPASEVKPGTPLQGGATMPEIKAGEAVVTLADGSVVPASSVKPGTPLQGGATMPAVQGGAVITLEDGSVVSASETVTLADGTVVAAKDVKPGTPLAGGGTMPAPKEKMVTLADGTVMPASKVKPGTKLAGGVVMPKPTEGDEFVTLADGTKMKASEVPPGTKLAGGGKMPNVPPGAAVVTLADGSVVLASEVPAGTPLAGGATMPAPVPMVTLADGRVMPMDKVPPGTELAGGAKMPRGETVMLADGTIVAKKDAPPGAALAGGGSMAVDETATVTLADGTVVLAKDVAPGTPLADGQVMAPRAGQMVTLADGTVCDAASVPPGAKLAGGGVMPAAPGAMVKLADGRCVPASEVPPGAPLADGGVMPIAPGGKVTLADGTVVDADKVPPGTKLAGGGTMPAAPGQKVTLHDGTMVDADQVPPGARLKGGTVMPTAAGATVTLADGTVVAADQVPVGTALAGGGVMPVAAGAMVTLADGSVVPAADVPPGTALADGGIMPVSNDPEATVTLADGTVVRAKDAPPGAKLANGGTMPVRAGAKVKLADGTICDPDKVPPGAQLANGGVMPAMPGAMVTLADGTVVAAAAVPPGAPLADGSVMPAPPPGATATLADGTVVPANAVMAGQQLADGSVVPQAPPQQVACVGGEEDSVADEIVNIVEGCDNPDLKTVLEPDCIGQALAQADLECEGEIGAAEWDGAVEGALEKKLAQRAAERDREGKGPNPWDAKGGKGFDDDEMDPALAALMAARDAWKDDTPWPTRVNASGEVVSINPLDIEFVAKFLDNASKAFRLIDLDDNGGMTAEELQESIAEEPEVVKFLWTCGNMDMQLMLDEKRFPASFAKLDRDKDGEISKHEWMLAIDLALEIRLKRFADQRARSQAAGEAEDAAFREEFKKLARKVFFLIDTDGSNSLTEEEIVRSLRYEEEVKTFLATCGNPLLGHLLDPKEIKKSLHEIDKNSDGEISLEEWDAIVEKALDEKLKKLRAERAKREAAERAEEEALTQKFLAMARKIFEMIDKDYSGTITKEEMVDAVENDNEIVDFLQNSGNLIFKQLLHPKRLEKALADLDTDSDGEISTQEWEEAVEAALRVQLGRLSADQKRRAALSRAEDEKFIAEFMAAARKVFELIDVDNSNSLATQELVDATTENQEVIQFMVNCGNKFLQDMLVPRRLRAALTEIDADGSGEIDKPEWEIAIQAALEKKLAELEAERAAQREADRLADEAFTKEFLAAAMEVFRMLDTDESMSLDHDEFVGGVAHNPMVKNFLKDCGNEFLQELLIPSRLDKAMKALDTDGSGVIEIEEWYGARRPPFAF